jgi:hypothetical protein
MMRGILLLAIVLAIGVCGSSHAADWSWSKADTAREIAGLALTVVDWGQTNDIVTRADRLELNPILGPRPTRKEVRRYFTAVLILHPIISALLPSQAKVWGFNLKPRAAWQYIYIGVEATATVSNWHSGLQVRY